MMYSKDLFFMTGALFGFLGIAAGAFGAHALKNKLYPALLETFEVAVRYQMYHAIVLISLFSLESLFPVHWMSLIGSLFIAGIVIFSGSLYLLVFTGVKAWGAITPVGGLLFLLGWLSLIGASYLNRLS